MLNTGDTIVSFVSQLEYEPSCHLNRPFTLHGFNEIHLLKWPIYTTDDDILLYSSSLLTMCEPTPEVITKYLNEIGMTQEEYEKEFLPDNEEVLEPEDYGERDHLVDDDDEVMYVEE